MRFGDCVAVAMIMVMVVIMMVVRMRMTLPSRRNAYIGFKLLNATRMDCSRVCPGCLDTCMRQELNDSFEILLGSFWRTG